MECEFCKENIEKHLSELGSCGVDIHFYDVTDSTNTRAKEYAKVAQRKGAVFVANEQSAGRGRRGRSFFSQRGTGIYISFLVFPDERISDITYLTPHAAVALSRAVEKCIGISPSVKWVNDLYIGDRKLAGILAECETDENGNLAYFVLGMGINVYKTAFPNEISDIATSLEDATGIRASRERLTALIINELLEILRHGDSDEVYQEYVDRSCILGRKVTVTAHSERYTATARTINRDFSLTVETEDGEMHRLIFGEVSTKISENK